MSLSPEETLTWPAPGGPTRPSVPGVATDSAAVLATKLFIPSLGRRSIQRPRLSGLLGSAMGARLTLVVAPAGWGKSTLLAQWLGEAGAPCGWLSLDAADDDVTRFWRYLLLAVRRADAVAGAAALRRLDTADADVERDVLPVLVNELAGGRRDVVLVLDDYHLVRSGAVHRSLAALIEHAPGSLHLVISSRTDPPLPLSRLRVAGDLVEVRAAQLRFTAEESALLLGRASVSGLSPQEVQRLVDRTEGWAAGLQLAALRLAERPDRQGRLEFLERFTGADRHIVDYVGEEVLDALPLEVRDFLLQTSVLPRWSASLANAVTGRSDAGRMLEVIRRGNLFLTALDDDGRWYRYHQLFRDLLLADLERSGLVDPAVLHRRAAEWFDEHGELGEAIRHALASRDTALAGELVSRGWRSEFNHGHLQTVERWLDALPSSQVATDVRLTVARVWLHMDRGRLDEAGAALAAAGPTAVEDGQLGVLAALHGFKAGNVPLAVERLARVHGPLPDPFLVTVRDLLAGVCALWLGETAEASRRLHRAAARAEDTDNRLARVYALGARALGAVLAGDAGSAEAWVHEAGTVADDARIGAHFVAMFPALAAARLSALRGRWDEAATCAVSAARLSGGGAGRVEQTAALLTAAEATRHAGADGEREARRWFDEAAAVLRDCADPGPVVRHWFSREQRAQRGERTSAVALTERELAVLALLPAASSQRELAGSLFVSPNTIKTHLRGIYRKLGVASRDEAVLRARSLGLF